MKRNGYRAAELAGTDEPFFGFVCADNSQWRFSIIAGIPRLEQHTGRKGIKGGGEDSQMWRMARLDREGSAILVGAAALLVKLQKSEQDRVRMNAELQHLGSILKEHRLHPRQAEIDEAWARKQKKLLEAAS